MTSIDSALEIINADLDAERNEHRRRPANINLKDLKNRGENNQVESIVCKDRVRKNNITVLPTIVAKEKANKIDNLQIFQQCMRFIQFFGNIVGCYISYSWKPNAAFIFTISLIVFTWSQFIYSQYLHINNNEHIKLLEVFAIYGLALSVVYKMVVYLRKTKELNALHLSIHKICKENSTVGRAVNLNVRLLNNFNFYKWLAFTILLSIGVYVAYPLKAFIVDGQFIPLLPIEIMFIDQSTRSGFFIANLIMVLMGTYACIFCVFFNLTFAAIIMNYAVQVDGIEQDFRVLDDMFNRKSDTNVQYRHLFLRNICQKLQDIDKYLRATMNELELGYFYCCFSYLAKVKEMYDSYVFTYFSSTYVCQIISLFEIVAHDWKPGYGLAYGMFLEMMFYCYMGSRVTTDNDRLCFVLQQSNWYTYDSHSKKMYLTLYISSLNAKKLWIGKLAPLTVFTGTNIIKSIFGYYRVMMEVIK